MQHTTWLGRLLSWFRGESREQVDTTDYPVSVDSDIADTVGTIERPARKPAGEPSLWIVKNSDRRRKLWCGPTVVSTIIGIDAAVARDIIKAHRGGRAVMGTTALELDIAFRAHGCRLDLLADHSHDPPTLGTWFRLPRDPNAALVVEVTGHWVAVRGDWFCDTFTEGRPVRLRHAPRKRKRVQRVYGVSLL